MNDNLAREQELQMLVEARKNVSLLIERAQQLMRERERTNDAIAAGQQQAAFWRERYNDAQRRLNEIGRDIKLIRGNHTAYLQTARTVEIPRVGWDRIVGELDAAERATRWRRIWLPPVAALAACGAGAIAALVPELWRLIAG